MFNFIKKLFQKNNNEVTTEQNKTLLIPKYIRKLEEKYNVTLENEYTELVNSGITGKKIIVKTLIIHIKSLKKK